MNKFLEGLLWGNSMKRDKKGGSKDFVKWEEIRKYCTSDEQADEMAKKIAKTHGVHITYRGEIIWEYEK